MKLLEFGDTAISRAVETDDTQLSPFEIFPDFTDANLKENTPWLSPRFFDAASQNLTITIQSFVVQMAGMTILVDTCVGDHKQRERGDFHEATWNWLERLEQSGVRAVDVDLVICSHLHVDHVGWNTKLSNGRWVPTFPNAKYLMSKKELDYWQSEIGRASLQRTGDYVADSVLPVLEANQAELVDENYALNEKIWFEHTPGHTPGHMSIHVADGGEEIILSGDVMHHPLQLRHTEFSTQFCADQDQARITRKKFLNKYADTGTLILPAHFHAPTAGQVCRHENHFGFKFLGETDTLV